MKEGTKNYTLLDWRGWNKTVCTDRLIIYVENSMISTKNIRKLVSELSKCLRIQEHSKVVIYVSIC